MTPAEATRLFQFNEWANARFLSAIADLTDEQFTAPVVSSYSSVQETWAHLIGAEWIWLERWNGCSPSALPPWMENATRSELTAKLHTVEAQRSALLAKLSADALGRTLAYRRMSGQEHTNRLSDLFVHLVNHSTYHRGQLATLLRQLGRTPPSTDFDDFTGSQP